MKEKLGYFLFEVSVIVYVCFAEIFNNVNENVKSKPRRQSFLRRSLAWDSAFVTSAGDYYYDQV